jgi:glucan biosynthesis protein C
MSELSASPAQRWHELDAVRAFALLLGVVLHGVMSFMTPRVWIVADTATDPAFNIAFYVIHIFRMVTFFVLAGFFARMMLQKRGVGGFIANRLKRIALPLVVFWPLVIASIVVVMIIANAPAPGTPAVPPPPPPAFNDHTFPLTHLWFLYALLLLYIGALVVKIVTDILHVGGVLGRLLDGIVAGLVRTDLISAVLILPVAAAFYVNDSWTMWFGVATPDTGFYPNTAAVAAFTTAFAFGWWLNRRSDLIDHLAGRFWLYGISAAVGTWLCLKLAGTSPVLTPTAGHDHPLYCLLYPLTTWSWTFFLIGGARRFLSGANCVSRYLADSSYWVFIVHVPILLVLQYLVKDLSWPVEAKAVAVLWGTFAIALLTYQILVRHTFIGSLLNGRRRKGKTAPVAEAALA